MLDGSGVSPSRLNPRLLHFLAAVAHAHEHGVSLEAASGLDMLDLYHFLAVAREAGLIHRVGGAWRPTPYGLNVARSECDPYRDILRMTEKADHDGH